MSITFFVFYKINVRASDIFIPVILGFQKKGRYGIISASTYYHSAVAEYAFGMLGSSRLWYNMREHNEPSGCEADIWRMCANHDEAERNHGMICAGNEQCQNRKLANCLLAGVFDRFDFDRAMFT